MPNLMTTPLMLPDLKDSAGRSAEGGAYSCAFPSWPNRPWLDCRRPYPEPVATSPPTAATLASSPSSLSPSRHDAVPSVEFLDSLRRRPRPDQAVFEDDDDGDDAAEHRTSDSDHHGDDHHAGIDSDSSPSSSSSASAYMARLPLPKAQRSNSLLSRAFSQLQQHRHHPHHHPNHQHPHQHHQHHNHHNVR